MLVGQQKIGSMPTLLALIAHPDDESYSFGGTMALAARAGWRCIVECASAGERGKRHDGGPAGAGGPGGRDNVGEARMKELAESCRILGADRPRIWGLADGGMRESGSQAARILDLFKELEPGVVLSLGSDGAYGHPDHVALYGWLREALSEAGPELAPAVLYAAFPKGLFVPQWERCIGMLGEPPSPAAAEIGSESFDYEVPIAAVAATKLEAIAAHRTQLPGGDVEAIFPAGIVAALLSSERFLDARGRADEAVEEIFRSFSG